MVLGQPARNFPGKEPGFFVAALRAPEKALAILTSRELRDITAQKNAHCRVRTYDSRRVKAVLYH